MAPEIIAAFLVPITACATILVLGLRIIAYKQGRNRPAPDAPDFGAVERRLARVEVALDDVATELGRLGEGQQFLTKVLAERGVDAVLPAARQHQ